VDDPTEAALFRGFRKPSLIHPNFVPKQIEMQSPWALAVSVVLARPDHREATFEASN
jgi:hypothetical protein